MSNIQKLSAYLDKDKKIEEILGANAPSFVSSVLTLATNDRLLKDATMQSIYTSALMAASLKLSIQPSLGQAYIIGYKDRTGQVQAQFQIGYKGLVQLALRTGQFRKIRCFEVREGQLVGLDPMMGNQYNWNCEEPGETIGFGAYFQLINGFEAEMYMSQEQVKGHATRYSQAFKKNYGPWKDNYSEMAQKTVLKLLLNKQAPVSIETDWGRAAQADGGVINDVETLDITYPDNETPSIEALQFDQEKERIRKHIKESKDLESLEMVIDLVGEYSLSEEYDKKKGEL